MHAVALPDPLFVEAQRAAAASGLSVESFVAEAVQLHLQDGVLRLTPGQVAKVQEGQADVKAGRVYTPEQAKANLDAHRKEWLAAHPS